MGEPLSNSGKLLETGLGFASVGVPIVGDIFQGVMSFYAMKEQRKSARLAREMEMDMFERTFGAQRKESAAEFALRRAELMQQGQQYSRQLGLKEEELGLQREKFGWEKKVTSQEMRTKFLDSLLANLNSAPELQGKLISISRGIK